VIVPADDGLMTKEIMNAHGCGRRISFTFVDTAHDGFERRGVFL
jgi:hypothetical protein